MFATLRTLPFLALSTCLLGLPLEAGPGGFPQDGAEAPAQDEQAAEVAPPEEPAEFVVPETLQQAVELSLTDLGRGIEVTPVERLSEILEEWMALVVAQQRVLKEAEAAPEGSELEKSASVLGADRDALISRAEVIIQALADKGGDVEPARQRIQTIRGAEARELDRTSTVPVDQQEAQSLGLEILRAQLRPLTQEQVKEQLGLWLELLQRKCLEVRKVEVAALVSEDPEEIGKFTGRAVILRAERGRLLERVKAVITALERKGGDVSEASAYVKSVVVTPPITGWRAAWSTSRTWLTNPDGGLTLLRTLGLALFVVVSSWFVSRLAGRLTERAFRSMKSASELLREFLVGAVRKSTLAIGLLIAFSQMGIDMAPLLAAIGAAGLVIGFALQGTLSNFASGLMIMVYRPFDVGDTVSAAGITGRVQGMTLVSTTITTFDNQTIYVPNNKIWGDVITNVTANPTRRVDLTFGIGYGDDLDRAREVIAEVVAAHEKVLASPEPNIRVGALADSSVNFIVRPWARTEDYWDVYWDLTKQVKQRFDREGITIPFPQRDVHLHSVGGKESDYEVTPRRELAAATEVRQSAQG